MAVLKKEAAPRYLRAEGISSYLLASPRTSAAKFLTTSLVELQPDGEQRVHSHDPEQVYYLLEGTGLMTLGEETVRVKAGDCVFIPSGVPHGLKNDGPAPLRYFSAAAPSFAPKELESFWPLPSEATVRTDLVVEAADPRGPEAGQLIRKLSVELAQRYDFVDDGSGHFKPEDALAPGSVFLLGRIDGRPVACGALRPLEPGVAEVKRMFVEPDCRGRGYARRVLAELERWAGTLGYAIVRLETGILQPEAIRLYERAGYRRTANFGIYVGNQRSVCFEKVLPSGSV